MNKNIERLYNGVIKENPTFVLMLGMCPTLAVTTSAINGLGMGLSTMVVLALSNMIISALRKIIPEKVRIPSYIVIIATFVTVVELLMHAYVPSLYSALGIYISLIVVNCIILGRAESYASKNPVLPSLFDGIGMGLGFTVALTIIGLIREFLGAGSLFGFDTARIFGDSFGNVVAGMITKTALADKPGVIGYIFSLLTDEFTSFSPIGILVMAPGAFFVLAALTAIQNWAKDKGAKKGKDTSKIQSGCGFDCMNCNEAGCAQRKSEMVDNSNETETIDKEELIASLNDEEDTSSDSKDEAVETNESVDEISATDEEIKKDEEVEDNE